MLARDTAQLRKGVEVPAKWWERPWQQAGTQGPGLQHVLQRTCAERMHDAGCFEERSAPLQRTATAPPREQGRTCGNWQ